MGEGESTARAIAGYILVPTDLLKREIGDYQRIDAVLVQSVAAKFRTSLEVMIDRLCNVEPSNPIERCVLLLRRLNGDAVIRASYFGAGLLPILQRPRKYTRVTDWLEDFPRRAIERREDTDWGITRMGRPIKFTKTELGKSEDFLLQVQAKRVLYTSRRALKIRLELSHPVVAQ